MAAGVVEAPQTGAEAFEDCTGRPVQNATADVSVNVEGPRVQTRAAERSYFSE